MAVGAEPLNLTFYQLICVICENRWIRLFRGTIRDAVEIVLASNEDSAWDNSG